MAEDDPSPRRDGRTTDTRQRIEATALRLFATRGFAATSLRNIADELGITKAALYYHFPAKKDLARSVFQPFIDDVDALLSRLDGRRSPREILSAYAEALVPHRATLTAMLRDPAAAVDLDLAEVSARWLSRVGALLDDEDDPSPERRVRTTVAFGGLTRALMLPDAEEPATREAAVAAAVAALDSR
ncbi:helix-turn-helix domain-containing protein [Pseudonocardia sp. NPDC046786]|uniref:TetR/AcrR family transcriptional regulator n=1 Tax=Pseudonocardia sp. NPDC046786 TaxID=3155471 RepID=UPI0033C8EE87